MDIVAWITKERPPLPVPGKVLQLSAIIDADQKFVRVIDVVEIWITCGPGPIQ